MTNLLTMVSLRNIFLLSFFVGLICFNGLVKAELISGTIHFLQGQTFFIDSNTSKKYSLKITKVTTENIIQKLEEGDGITGDGLFQEDFLLLDEIHFVGLRDLIGYWSSDKIIFYFKDFLNLNIYMKNAPSIPNFFQISSLRKEALIKNIPHEEWVYAIIPGSKKEWKILFSQMNSIVMIGEMTLDQKKIHLQIQNPQTGEVIQKIDLIPLPEEKKTSPKLK